jgi:hypothetical protein
MLLTGMLASLIMLELLAWWPPCRDIEVLSPHQPIHPALLWARWHELKAFAGTLLTGGIELLPEVRVIVTGEYMSTEAFGVFPESAAL